MSKVILDISMSLDGLIARPDDDPGPAIGLMESRTNPGDPRALPRREDRVA